MKQHLVLTQKVAMKHKKERRKKELQNDKIQENMPHQILAQLKYVVILLSQEAGEKPSWVVIKSHRRFLIIKPLKDGRKSHHTSHKIL